MVNIAHLRQDNNSFWITQSLANHSKNVARIASDFAAKFGNPDWGYLLGKIHDLGKMDPKWQNYIKCASGYDLEIMKEEKERGNHSTAGAQLLLDKFYHNCTGTEKKLIALFLSYIVAGHHAGLPDFYEGSGASLTSRLFKSSTEIQTSELDKIIYSDSEKNLLEIKAPKTKPANGKIHRVDILHLWIRMLYSCLVDADYLDTELFMSPQISTERGRYLSINELKDRFDFFMSGVTTNAVGSQVNKERQTILSQCIKNGKGKPGFYSLTVPTGGGKTLSAMAFALEHAATHNKDRIIMAIPYTSIIEQTAKVYKYGSDDDDQIIKNINEGNILFGEDNVLEHHSNVDPENQEYKHLLASQNWDAPIIVTTNVQLLQSLHSSHPSDCRKLHNIVNSIIILDEAQMLPPEFLEPVISTLRGLVESFDVTVLFCTATQPSLTGTIGSSLTSFTGIDSCKEIIDHPEELMKNLNRVRYELKPQGLAEKLSWEEIASELTTEEQVLCVVNTRKDCRDLFNLMPEGTMHLSGYMCHEEISDHISQIKRKLRNNETLRVISTQLVEAGVDIDFPVVWRALSGIDSIAQAAGRCNREGKISGKGKVVIFMPPNPSPLGSLKISAQVAETIIKNVDMNMITPETFKKYFDQFYAFLHELDKPKFKELLVNGAQQGRFQFRTFSSQFKIIDDKKQVSIFVQYENSRNSGKDLINRLRREGPSRGLMSKLQRFAINIPRHVFTKLYKDGAIETVENFYILSDCFYKNGLGVVIDGNAVWKVDDYFL